LFNQDKSHEERSSLTRTIKRRADYFFGIAALSVVNAIILLCTGTGISYFTGFGATSALLVFSTWENFLTVTIVPAAVFITALFILLGIYGRKFHSWAFVTGFFIYAIDSLFLILVEDWGSVILHCIIIFFIYQGLNATSQYNKLKSRSSGW
jgi:hypothetical protein